MSFSLSFNQDSSAQQMVPIYRSCKYLYFHLFINFTFFRLPASCSKQKYSVEPNQWTGTKPAAKQSWMSSNGSAILTTILTTSQTIFYHQFWHFDHFWHFWPIFTFLTNFDSFYQFWQFWRIPWQTIWGQNNGFVRRF